MTDISVDENALLLAQEQAESAEWVDSNERLAQLCQQWRQQPLLALDTEFIRTDTFYPQAGLIQVASQGRCYLVDPLKITEYGEFIDLLNDPKVLKLLHSCSEDLEVFAHQFETVPQPLFDTQIACAFLDMGLSIGYQRLVDTLFGVEVGKEETRSDWLQRPLTGSQRHYAAIDVAYLEQTYALLSARLNEQRKYPWVLEECRRLTDAALLPDDHGASYQQRFKQAWKLDRRQLAVLKSLSAWRESEARQRDIPRNFLLHNNSIMAIANRPPMNMRELAAIERMRGRMVSSEGKELLELIQQAWDSSEDEYPELLPRPLPSNWSKHLKSLKGLINAIAEQHQLTPELLVRRKDLEQLVRSGMDNGRFELPVELTGWREPTVGGPLLKALQAIAGTASDVSDIKEQV